MAQPPPTVSSLKDALHSQISSSLAAVNTLATDVTVQQETAQRSLSRELAGHRQDVEQMKASWEERHTALTKAFHENASVQFEAIEKQAGEQAKVLQENAAGQFQKLQDDQSLMKDLQKTLQQELDELRLALSEERAQRGKSTEGMKEELEELRSALHEERAQQARSIEDMKAQWHEKHCMLSKAVDDGLGTLATQQAKVLEEKAKNTEEMKTEWHEKHSLLSKAVDDGLGTLAAEQAKVRKEHAKVLEEKASSQAKAFAILGEMKSDIGAMFEKFDADQSMQHDSHNQKFFQQSATHEKLRQDLSVLRSDIVELGKDVVAAQQEAHAALRLELAAHENNAAEMQARWEEAHKTLSGVMDDGLGKLAAEHGEVHTKHAAALGTFEELHSTLQEEISALRSEGASSLKRVSEGMSNEVDTIRVAVVRLGKEVAAAQDEAHEALRLELAAHGKDAAEMKAAMEESASNLKRVSEGMSSEVHTKHAEALGSFEELHSKLQQEIAALQSESASNLKRASEGLSSEVNTIRVAVVRLGKEVAAAQEEAHEALRLELAAHGKDAAEMKAAMDEGFSQLVAEHSKAFETHSTALKEKLSSQANVLEEHAVTQAKALEEHIDAHAKALSEHAEAHTKELQMHSLRHASTLTEIKMDIQSKFDTFNVDHSAMHDSHAERHSEQADLINEGFAELRKKLREDLGQLRSDQTEQARNLREVSDVVTSRIKELTLDLVRLGSNVTAAQDEAHAAMRLELATHGKTTAEAKLAWEEMQNKMLEEKTSAHTAALDSHTSAHRATLAEMKLEIAAKLEQFSEQQVAMQKALLELRADHSKALDESIGAHAKRLEEHSITHRAALDEMRMNSDKHTEYAAAIGSFKELHSKLQQEMSALRSEYAGHSKNSSGDLSSQVDKLTLSIGQLRKDVAAAQEEAHSALRSELAVHERDAAETFAAWDEAHNGLLKKMDERICKLTSGNSKAFEELSLDLQEKLAAQAKALEEHAEVHAKALEEHVLTQAKSLEDHSSTHAKTLQEHLSTQAKALEEHASTHAKTLEEHTSTQAKALAEHADVHAKELDKHSLRHNASLDEIRTDMEGKLDTFHADHLAKHDSHAERHSEHALEVEGGFAELRKRLKQELVEIRSEQAQQANTLREISEVMTSSVKELNSDMVKLGSNVAEAQKDAHEAVRLELATHGRNAEEMQAFSEEVHNTLSKTMEDRLSKLATEHAKSQDLLMLRSEHESALKRLTEDIQIQIDTVTLSMVHLSRDVATSQEEALSALRLELVAHGENAAEMKTAWEEAHRALAKTVDEGHDKLVAEHAEARIEYEKALEENASAQAVALDEHTKVHARALEERSTAQVAILADMAADIEGKLDIFNAEHSAKHDLHAERHDEFNVLKADLEGRLERLHAEHLAKHDFHTEKHEQHSTALDEGFEYVHGRLQQELAAFQAGHVKNMKDVSDEMSKMIELHAAAQEESKAALRAELAEHGKSAAVMNKTWDEKHKLLARGAITHLEKLAVEHERACQDHSQALRDSASAQTTLLEEHMSANARAMEKHALTHAASVADLEKIIASRLEQIQADNSSMHESHNQKYAQHVSAFNKKLEDLHTRLQHEFMAFKTDQTNNFNRTVEDVTIKMNDFTLSVSELCRDTASPDIKKQIEEWKAEREEEHKLISQAMDDAFRKLAAESRRKQSDMFEEMAAEQAKSFEERAEAQSRAQADALEAVRSDLRVELGRNAEEMKKMTAA